MKKKSFIMLLCAIVVMTSVAFGTIAYLTDRESVTNKFTMGNVDIIVDEEVVDPNPDPDPDDPDPDDPDPDHPDPERTEEGNEYDIEPGGEYKKDPTMTVKAGSKEAYVRMMVEISHADELDQIFSELKIMYPDKFAEGFVPADCVGGWDETVWPCTAMTKDTETNTYVLEFRYPEAVAAAADEDTVLPALFTTLKVPGEITTKQLQTIQDLTIEVVGHAIQTTGFADADAAWAAFDAQITAEDKLAAATQPEEGE